MRLIRVMAAALILAAAPIVASNVRAQESIAPSASEATQSEIEAARDLLEAFLIDSGIVQHAAQVASSDLGPQFRTQITSSTMFQNLTAAHQEAVRETLDRTASMIAEEINAQIPAAIEIEAPRLAALFSEGTSRGVARFVRSPEGRSAILGAAAAGALGRPGTSRLTAAEEQAQRAFLATPAGNDFMSHQSEFNAVMDRITSRVFQEGQSRFENRLLRETCAAMGNECPAALRIETQ